MNRFSISGAPIWTTSRFSSASGSQSDRDELFFQAQKSAKKIRSLPELLPALENWIFLVGALEADRFVVELRELLENAGHIGHPLLDLGSGAASAQVRQVPGARLPLAVDEGDDVVLLLLLLLQAVGGGGGAVAVVLQAAHDQLGVVFEVVHLGRKTQGKNYE
jgi:hypothetical protein